MRTPLLEAVDVNSPLIVDMLIKAEANLDLEDIKGTTPLLDASFQIGKMQRNKQLNVEIVKLLIAGAFDNCDINICLSINIYFVVSLVF